MGMDSAWFPTFIEAYFDSFAVTSLPIWRVFKTNEASIRDAITSEGPWEATWAIVMERRAADPDSRYDCDTDLRMPVRYG